jgi:predicted amidophosphoribosyltransferase
MFATGASMGAICTLLQTHPKVASVYAAAVTKTGKA